MPVLFLLQQSCYMQHFKITLKVIVIAYDPLSLTPTTLEKTTNWLPTIILKFWGQFHKALSASFWYLELQFWCSIHQNTLFNFINKFWCFKHKIGDKISILESCWATLKFKISCSNTKMINSKKFCCFKHH